MNQVAENPTKTIIHSSLMVVVQVVVLKKYFHLLDKYLKDQFRDYEVVNLTPISSGRHNSKGYNRISIALQDSGLKDSPENYQGYQLRYPLELNSLVGKTLQGFKVS